MIDINDIVFIPWDESKRLEIIGGLGPVRTWTEAQGRQTFGEDRDGVKPKRCRVMRGADGDLVGVAAYGTNDHHPAYLYAYVEVAEKYRRRGVGKRAFAEVCRLAGHDGRDFDTKYLLDTPAHRFAEAMGFFRIQLVREPIVDVGALPDRDYGVTEYEPAKEEVPDDAVEAWGRFYEATHTWSPPRERDLAIWREDFFSVRAGRFFEVRVAGKVVGVGFLNDSFSDDPQEDPHPIFAGCSVDPADPEGPAIVTAMLKAAAVYSEDGRLRIEMDESNRATVEAVEPAVVYEAPAADIAANARLA
ncbi:GNAT family N-acetyltransferase [Salininema proteolyticum]|uniref:GNAT family N-acetyltransferase n=1 Tax=Salininema proteolyticum TaxID=1607685 RepID=A0ABV8TVD9_9ACTN